MRCADQHPVIHGGKYPTRPAHSSFQPPNRTGRLPQFFDAEKVVVVAYAHGTSTEQQLFYLHANSGMPIFTEAIIDFNPYNHVTIKRINAYHAASQATDYCRSCTGFRFEPALEEMSDQS